MTPTKPNEASGVREWLVEDLGFDGLYLSPANGQKHFNKDLCPLLVTESCVLIAANTEIERLRAALVDIYEQFKNGCGSDYCTHPKCGCTDEARKALEQGGGE